jgi:opacity protein-like surface antigen
MKNALLAAATALVLVPAASQAQTLQYPGFFAGVEAGGNYMFQSGLSNNGFGSQIYPTIGYSFGGMIGYDFVGPRIALEGLYNNNKSIVSGGNLGSYGATKDEIAVMANLYYDFNAGGTWVPYIGAGAGVAFDKMSALNLQDNTTNFAYQGIVGIGYNIDPTWRVNLEGRYFGTTGPTVVGAGFSNNNIIAMLQLQMKFGAPTEVAAPPPAPAAPQAPSFMVFFDWDRSDLSQRRADAVKSYLAGKGVPDAAMSTEAFGESKPLVDTADGVREPQNRRVEITFGPGSGAGAPPAQ